MPGPLPEPNRRRRNAPTIPTTSLPASGRKGMAPKPPKGYELAECGAAWWRWAWKLPQACAWDVGQLYVIARRAQLEDDLALLARCDQGLDLCELLGCESTEAARQLEYLIGRLRALATGKLALEREMRELDDRLGLTPKGFAANRYRIIDDSVVGRRATPAGAAPVTELDERRARLTANAP